MFIYKMMTSHGVTQWNGSKPWTIEDLAKAIGTGPTVVELAFGKVAELVKSFEHVHEILDGSRYKMGASPLNSTPFGIGPTRARGQEHSKGNILTVSAWRSALVATSHHRRETRKL